jgi:hypothetical protein
MSLFIYWVANIEIWYCCNDNGGLEIVRKSYIHVKPNIREEDIFKLENK